MGKSGYYNSRGQLTSSPSTSSHNSNSEYEARYAQKRREFFTGTKRRPYSPGFSYTIEDFQAEKAKAAQGEGEGGIAHLSDDDEERRRAFIMGYRFRED
jgi:hypothetical protein